MSTSSRERPGAGGTPGGIGQFFIGLIMAAAGGYLILNQVQVTTSFWRFGQYGRFGLTLLPLLIGIAFLFYNGRSVVGWLLTSVTDTTDLVLSLNWVFAALYLVSAVATYRALRLPAKAV